MLFPPRGSNISRYANKYGTRDDKAVAVMHLRRNKISGEKWKRMSEKEREIEEVKHAGGGSRVLINVSVYPHLQPDCNREWAIVPTWRMARSARTFVGWKNDEGGWNGGWKRKNKKEGRNLRASLLEICCYLGQSRVRTCRASTRAIVRILSTESREIRARAANWNSARVTEDAIYGRN